MTESSKQFRPRGRFSILDFGLSDKERSAPVECFLLMPLLSDQQRFPLLDEMADPMTSSSEVTIRRVQIRNFFSAFIQVSELAELALPRAIYGSLLRGGLGGLLEHMLDQSL